MTEEAHSTPADKFSVQVPQNLSFGEKLEMTKRKLHQSYQESSNARKQLAEHQSFGVGSLHHFLSRPADKTDVKMTREAQSSPAHKFSVHIPQNLSFGEKFEITKRKLHQSYLESDNARKQRSVKVLEADELPKKQDINEDKLREKR
ncbi:uncharacterized protein A4U43_C02F19530 [Asparagus officinalis]|uniref:Uncharacterized protein n=1 Tax=Asparagus officinalis TaxID=4686 RepID=A0A5P1FNG0_ASPOF|nr:uncharacterized protein A4U43_C02F19530 [Asparagus officinalis]